MFFTKKRLTKLENASILNILDKLQETRIVTKTHAITDEKNKKKVQYNLTDGMFVFWHIFVQRAIPIIEICEGSQYYEKKVKPVIHVYMGDIFETMCRYYLLKNGFSEKMPCSIDEVGRWYGTNPNTREQTDIDVVGLDKENKKSVIGECKFKTSPAGQDVYDKLIDRNGLIDKNYTNVGYFIFSLSGFTEWYNTCDKSSLHLVDIKDMYS